MGCTGRPWPETRDRWSVLDVGRIRNSNDACHRIGFPEATVHRTLRKLGMDIQDARRRGRLPMAVVAERAFTSAFPTKRDSAR